MGTRHNVVFMSNQELRFNEKNKKLYKKCIKDAPKVYVHWNGYPSGTLPILKDFLNSTGARARLHDPEYLSAWYIAWKIIYDFERGNLKDLDDYSGIGIETRLSEWADFTYIIKPQTINGNKIKPVIYVLDYNLKLIAKIEHINNLEELEYCEWWY